MNIFYVTLEHFDLQPILKSQVVPLIKSLKEDRGYNITLITSGDRENREGDHLFISANNMFLRFYHFYNLLKKRVSSTDIVHVRSYPALIPVLFLRLFKSFNIVWDMRGLVPQEYIKRLGLVKGIIPSVFYSFIGFFGVYFSNRIVVVSENFKLHILSRYKKLNSKKIQVIRTFSKSESNTEYKGIKSDGVIRVVYSGSMEKWQCVEEIASFFIQLNKSDKSFEFTVLTKEVDKAKRIFNNCDGLTIKSVPTEELIRHISSHNLGIIFREDISLNRVASPIKIADYIRSRVPIICNSGVGEYSKLIEGKNIGVNIDKYSSVKAITDAILSTSIENENFINFENEYLSFEKAIEHYSEIYKSFK